MKSSLIPGNVKCEMLMSCTTNRPLRLYDKIQAERISCIISDQVTYYFSIKYAHKYILIFSESIDRETRKQRMHVRVAL